jgi:LysR family transcriptional activator of nhaA
VRLICHEGTLQDLLAQLSVHRLDVVIADEPMGKKLSVKAFNHALGTTAMSFFAARRSSAASQGEFPTAWTARRC